MIFVFIVVKIHLLCSKIKGSCTIHHFRLADSNDICNNNDDNRDDGDEFLIQGVHDKNEQHWDLGNSKSYRVS